MDSEGSVSANTQTKTYPVTATTLALLMAQAKDDPELQALMRAVYQLIATIAKIYLAEGLD